MQRSRDGRARENGHSDADRIPGFIQDFRGGLRVNTFIENSHVETRSVERRAYREQSKRHCVEFRFGIEEKNLTSHDIATRRQNDPRRPLSDAASRTSDPLAPAPSVL